MSFQGANISLDDLKAKLAVIGKATPDQAITIKAGKKVPYDNVRQVLDICHNTGLKNVTSPLPPKTAAPTPSPTASTPAVRVPDDTNASPASPAPPVQETPTTTIP